ncbi:MAG: metal-dependent hydrolase [Methanomicrobiales archaeon]|nr:metal-dependent hydrolase [Methanomicrobiales archaeon]
MYSPKQPGLVDSASHALAACLPLMAVGLTPLVPFAVAGALVPDIDIVFHFLGNRNTGLLVASHGGFTHSFIGAFFAAGGVCLAGLAGPIGLDVAAIAAVLWGVLLHLALDLLAYPGIPLWYPHSSIKVTLGVFPGPSLFLAVLSFPVAGCILLGFIPPLLIPAYGVVFCGFILVSVIVKTIVASRLEGQTIPTRDPLNWIVLQNDVDEVNIARYSLFRGLKKEKTYAAYASLAPETRTMLEGMADFRRLRYFSYLLVIEKEGDLLTIRDPLREDGYVYYPPMHTRMQVDLSMEGS